MKLLIVDDSSIIRKTINAAYKNTVFTEIQSASDGMLAVTMFEKFLPDVVTLDITMPNMDGLSALSQILTIKPNTYVLTISALADHHTAIESLNRGAHQFICKPFTQADLKEALDDILNEINDNASQREFKAEATIKTDHYPSGFVSPPTINVDQLPSADVNFGTKPPKTLEPPKNKFNKAI